MTRLSCLWNSDQNSPGVMRSSRWWEFKGGGLGWSDLSGEGQGVIMEWHIGWTMCANFVMDQNPLKWHIIIFNYWTRKHLDYTWPQLFFWGPERELSLPNMHFDELVHIKYVQLLHYDFELSRMSNFVLQNMSRIPNQGSRSILKRLHDLYWLYLFCIHTYPFKCIRWNTVFLVWGPRDGWTSWGIKIYTAGRAYLLKIISSDGGA